MSRPDRPAATDPSHYHQHGYLLPAAAVLPQPTFEGLRSRFSVLATTWAQTYQQRPEAFDKPHFFYPELFEYLLHPAILDLVETVIGPDIGLFSSHFICKPPHTGQRVPWHEDSSYWQGIFDGIDQVCTLWLAIDPADADNGCLRVIAGSHRDGYSRYQAVADPAQAVFQTEIRAAHVDEHHAVDLALAPNRCSLHHARIIHGSHANHSPRRRCGLSIRYFSTRHRYLGGPLPDFFRIYLARGRDHAGNRYAEPRGVNQAWIDRVIAGQALAGHL